MNNRVLVAYASANGSTADVAIAVGKTLGARGFAVDVKPIRDNPPVDGYQSVVIGSAVHRGHWLNEAVDFVKANQATLNRAPVALFTVHITKLGDDEKSRRTREGFPNDVRPLVQPVTEAFFAGKFDRRGAALLMPGLFARLVPTFDLRNWDKINAWARTVFA